MWRRIGLLAFIAKKVSCHQHRVPEMPWLTNASSPTRRDLRAPATAQLTAQQGVQQPAVQQTLQQEQTAAPISAPAPAMPSVPELPTLAAEAEAASTPAPPSVTCEPLVHRSEISPVEAESQP